MVRSKQAKHSYVRFACPIRALQSHNGALLEYSMPTCCPAMAQPLKWEVRVIIKVGVNQPHTITIPTREARIRFLIRQILIHVLVVPPGRVEYTGSVKSLCSNFKVGQV
ncbi:hypothetical protein AVEN_247851-1 [Araneus ventricosus]|uniref:Uncharacterized protein n=1 Tax=Araneus ventricosus TaxID=182803 RepID=A0A4Y2IDZ5_ARAVE|nr:hypothetical protein AVEN_247851-1 [Araneus ventricosus]